MRKQFEQQYIRDNQVYVYLEVYQPLELMREEKTIIQNVNKTKKTRKYPS